MNTSKTTRSPLVLTALPLALALGCSTAAPPQSLVDARKQVDAAEHGQAAVYAPDQLLEARNLLDQAEQADSHSASQSHFAYLADRQARLAESEGEKERDQERLEQSEQRYSELQDERREEAEAGLAKTREELVATQRELGTLAEQMRSKDANMEAIDARRAALEREQASLEQKLESQGLALTRSEKAREEAEARVAAALASLRELAQVKEDANQTIVTLSGAVLFKTGASSLLPLAENALDQVANALKQLGDSDVALIKGHTDSQGADDMNLELSQARADSVRSYLVTKGVRPGALKAVGKGEAEPIADNSTSEGRANNRRVEIVIPKRQ